jgi:mono/diheme cytochrome c family protein
MRVAIVLAILVAGAWLILKLVRTSPAASPAAGNSNNANSGGAEKLPILSAAVSLPDGRLIFLRDCAHCHGDRGDGISPNMNTLHPAPFDLTAFELTDFCIQRVVREGLQGSDMPGWKLGADAEVRAVAAYAKSLGREDALSVQESYASPDALREAGRRIFAAHCVNCHGEQGKGDGPDAAKHLPRPASFAEMRPSFAAARRVIANGVRGTDMPSWPLLTAPEIQAVTFYVRTLYTSSSAGTGAQQ